MVVIETSGRSEAADSTQWRLNLRDRDAVRRWYGAVRRQTVGLTSALQPEDFNLQSMPDVSPAKWHLAHTTWFFETFVLQPFVPGYEVIHPQYCYLFNSYYEAVGERQPRPERSLLSRPTIDEVMRYRAEINRRTVDWILTAPSTVWDEVAERIELGLHHEQQHQELLLMDIKHAFSKNTLLPAAWPDATVPPSSASPANWIDYGGGLVKIGLDSSEFGFDNERPRCRVHLEPYQLADRLVTNGEMAAFIEDDGYSRCDLWLSDGWATVQTEGWQAPEYWRREDGSWFEFTLGGERPLDPHAPVAHLSLYESDAFARWSGARLPTEAEWEHAATQAPFEGNFLEDGYGQPRAADPALGTPRQMFGDVWELTQTSYGPYPGFQALPGALGEYNGKFMANQVVLRGGSCVTPRAHVRPTYRNFFYPAQRWAFQGLRLARDVRA